jgi:hypothetical protein
VSASTEVLLQERAANLWASPKQMGAAAAACGKVSTPCAAAALAQRPSAEHWLRLQASGDAATHAQLLSTAGLPFADRRQAWLAWSGAHTARERHAPNHYASLRARWLVYQTHVAATAAAASASEIGGGAATWPLPAAVGALPQDFAQSLDTIGRDLTRTCQEHEYFSEGDGLEASARLGILFVLRRGWDVCLG